MEKRGGGLWGGCENQGFPDGWEIKIVVVRVSVDSNASIGFSSKISSKYAVVYMLDYFALASTMLKMSALEKTRGSVGS